MVYLRDTSKLPAPGVPAENPQRAGHHRVLYSSTTKLFHCRPDRSNPVQFPVCRPRLHRLACSCGCHRHNPADWNRFQYRTSTAAPASYLQHRMPLRSFWYSNLEWSLHWDARRPDRQPTLRNGQHGCRIYRPIWKPFHGQVHS